MKLTASIILSLAEFAIAGQQPSAEQPKLFSETKVDAPRQTTMEPDRSKAQPDYILGPGDQITVRVANLEEIAPTPVMIDMSGYVRLPMAGRMRVSGLTVAQVEAEVTNRLKQYVKRPDVSVSVTEFHS